MRACIDVTCEHDLWFNQTGVEHDHETHSEFKDKEFDALKKVLGDDVQGGGHNHGEHSHGHSHGAAAAEEHSHSD